MKILGIGNAIVDVLCKVSDEFLTNHSLTKSTMKLVNEGEFKKILSNLKIEETEGVFTIKNENTTIGFIRFNEKGEVEYIFVNPIFRKQGLATKLLRLVKQKTGKEIILQEPISPLGSKLLKSLNKWK